MQGGGERCCNISARLPAQQPARLPACSLTRQPTESPSSLLTHGASPLSSLPAEAPASPLKHPTPAHNTLERSSTGSYCFSDHHCRTVVGIELMGLKQIAFSMCWNCVGQGCPLQPNTYGERVLYHRL